MTNRAVWITCRGRIGGAGRNGEEPLGRSVAHETTGNAGWSSVADALGKGELSTDDSGLARQALGQLIDLAAKGWIDVHAFVDRFDRVHDSRVIAAAEVSADFLKAKACAFAGEPHADLARLGDGFVAPLGLQVAEFDAVVNGDGVNDLLKGDLTGRGRADRVAQRALGQFKRDRMVLQHGVALDGGDGAFEFTCVGFDAIG